MHRIRHLHRWRPQRDLQCFAERNTRVAIESARSSTSKPALPLPVVSSSKDASRLLRRCDQQHAVAGIPGIDPGFVTQILHKPLKKPEACPTQLEERSLVVGFAQR